MALELISFYLVALKIKLMVRRSANQLVEQGILPRKYNFKIKKKFF